jgi:hypothetical protein
MTTAADIFKLSLRDIGAIDEVETPTSALMDDARTTLNQMLAFWRVENINVYADRLITFTPTGAETYTIGAGGVINVDCPQRIDYAYYRLNNIDYEIEVINAFRQYSQISFKNVNSIPEVIYLNATHPLGMIYTYPRVSTGTINLQCKIALPAYSLAANDINVPSEYELCVRYNLSCLLAPVLGLQLNQQIERSAQNMMRVLRRSNAQIQEQSLFGGKRISSIISGI